MSRFQLGNRYGPGPGQSQIRAPGFAEIAEGNAHFLGLQLQHLNISLTDSKDIARLVLAEPEGVVRAFLGPGQEIGADARGHRHLGDRDQGAAVRDVMAGADQPALNQVAHEIAVAAFGREVDRRGRALLPTMDLAQEDREFLEGDAERDDRDRDRDRDRMNDRNGLPGFFDRVERHFKRRGRQFENFFTGRGFKED